MTDPSPTPITDIEAYIAAQEKKTLLRFITCGSVDDGKSTLIGRLLWESKLIFEDQLAALERDSKQIGTQGDEIDFALLLDGLEAEREQGITIDVAYRFFATEDRKYIVADTPGHEQYTRNMATGASTADLAVILVDAGKGILPQTMRHSHIVSLIGVRQVLLAINKMDTIGYSQSTFDDIRDAYLAFAATLDFDDIECIPISALVGDNILEAGSNMGWYDGPTIMAHLAAAKPAAGLDDAPLRLPVQRVIRPDSGFRGYAGTIASGSLRPGDEILVAGSGQPATVSRIVTFDGDLDHAGAGRAVTLELVEEIDISRGDMLSDPQRRPATADQFEAKLIWMSDEPMLPGRRYLVKLGTATVPARITNLKYEININTGEHVAANTLALNGIGVCNIALEHDISFDPYAENRLTGAFILIDWYTNATVAAGTVDFALRRATNIHRQHIEIDKTAHARLKGQRPLVLWFTGLSGSGKSTIANLVERELHGLAKHTYILDGDNVRHGLNKDLGFTDADRVENIRRVAETAKMMVDAGIIVLVSFISPFRDERQMARDLMDEGEFWEVFVDTPLEICEQRDAKGLYKKARAGEIENFTGISSEYQRPSQAELVIDGAQSSAEEAAERIVAALREAGAI